MHLATVEIATSDDDPLSPPWSFSLPNTCYSRDGIALLHLPEPEVNLYYLFIIYIISARTAGVAQSV